MTDSDEDKKLKSEWTKMFLEHNGFEYILKTFMEKEIKATEDKLSTNAHFELKHIAFLLKLLRIFIMAAFSTSADASGFDQTALIRRSSNVEEDSHVIQSIQDNSRFAELQKQMQGPIGEQIITQIDYSLLQQKILKLIAQVLEADRKDMTFEEKLIVENALSLWVGCILHKTQLLNDFFSTNSDDFLMRGLLLCQQDKIREEFKVSLSLLSQKLLVGKELKEIPLTYLLRLLTSKFSLISKHPCRQYFELFCELIDHYFSYAASIKGTDVFNPESLLGLIIDQIKEFNTLNSA